MFYLIYIFLTICLTSKYASVISICLSISPSKYDISPIISQVTSFESSSGTTLIVAFPLFTEVIVPFTLSLAT